MGIHYAGFFDAPGAANTYAAVFNRGDVVANEAGESFDFRVESNNKNGMFFVDGTNDRVGIGTDAPGAALHLIDDNSSGRIALIENQNTGNGADALAIRTGPASNPTAANQFIAFRDNSGGLVGSVTGDGSGGINFNTTSDRRLKMNIEDFQNALEMVNKIKTREYERKSKPGEKEIGFIAQELFEVYPEIVSGTPDQPVEDPMTVDYGKLTPVLVAAIQELAKENDQLKNQLHAQSEMMTDLSQKINQLTIIQAQNGK